MSRFTRRHWGRELSGWVLLPFSMFLSKNISRPTLSMQRVILGVFVFMFALRFPVDWNWEAVAAMAVLTFALILETLFAAVPMREMLTALLAYFGGKAAKHVKTLKIEETEESDLPIPPDNPPEEPDARPR